MVSSVGILENVIDPERADLSQELATYLLSLGFTPADQARYSELADKASEGTLSAEEQQQLDEFLLVNDFLAIVKAKARKSLQKQSPSV